MPPLKRLTVLLGAGASYDCANASSTINLDWRPPLARELFNIAHRKAFEPLLRSFAGARFLSAELAELSLDSSFSIESQLREYSVHPDTRIREHYLDIPRYLRQLILTCTSRYTPTPGSYLRLVKALLADSPHDVLFITLNYDDLLERALLLLDERLSFLNVNQYVLPGRRVLVCKVHGSVDWVVQMTPHKVGADTVHYKLPKRPWQITMSHQALQLDQYPVITPPLTGKSLDDFACPEQHVQVIPDFLPTCEKFLFVGTSGLDDNVLHLIETAAPKPKAIHYVGADDIADVRRKIEATAPRLRLKTNEHYAGGFRKYLADPAFQRFLIL